MSNPSAATPTSRQVTLQWLGQAGFALRGPSGSVAIDPYLSDLCRAVHGLQRMVDPPTAPGDLAPDLVLVSHWHEDHLDLDAAADFVAAGAHFIAPPSCIARLAGRGLPSSALSPITVGERIDHAGMTVTAVAAAHRVPGYLTEDAVGFVVQLDAVRVFHSGDTEYDRGILTAVTDGALDVALLCVNGTGGNMNAWEAATLAAQLQATVTVPMHFGMWSTEAYGPGGTLDPEQFSDLYHRLDPDARVHIPTLGETFSAVPGA